MKKASPVLSIILSRKCVGCSLYFWFVVCKNSVEKRTVNGNKVYSLSFLFLFGICLSGRLIEIKIKELGQTIRLKLKLNNCHC